MVRLVLLMGPGAVCLGALGASSLLDAACSPRAPGSVFSLAWMARRAEVRLWADAQGAPATAEGTDGSSDREAELAATSAARAWGPAARAASVAVRALVAAHLVWAVHGGIFAASFLYSAPTIFSLRSRALGPEAGVVDDFREAYAWRALRDLGSARLGSRGSPRAVPVPPLSNPPIHLSSPRPLRRLEHNTPEGSVVGAWWDYGYQLAQMAGRPTLTDNHTSGQRSIATVGRALASPEPRAWEILRREDADYFFIHSGAIYGGSGHELSKLRWISRIAGHTFPEIDTESIAPSDQQLRVGEGAEEKFLESLAYRLTFSGLGEAYDVAHKEQCVDTTATWFDEVHSTRLGRLRVFRRRNAPLATTT